MRVQALSHEDIVQVLFVNELQNLLIDSFLQAINCLLTLRYRVARRTAQPSQRQAGYIPGAGPHTVAWDTATVRTS